MKLNDLGITLVLVCIVLVGAASAIHKHKAASKCAECEEVVEDAIELAVDEMLNVPHGTTDKVVDAIAD